MRFTMVVVVDEEGPVLDAAPLREVVEDSPVDLRRTVFFVVLAFVVVFESLPEALEAAPDFDFDLLVAFAVVVVWDDSTVSCSRLS